MLLAASLAGCGQNPVDTVTTEHGHTHGPDTHVHELKTPGPNGGRLITSVEPNFEFLVLEDRKVRLTFVDGEAKPIEVTDAVISLIGGDRSAPTELAFDKAGNVLISDGALPGGDVVPVILDIMASPTGELVSEKFNVDFSTCSECKLTEYACICAH
ncbi:MAG: hypothetical protein M2R45_04250 [Verrucomicrobia subdivision 3 bacterium]|nr:hypothetical protein [Limisphaerales bacterium]MCS1412626.1 hypothetical protein [Limisphaerales bacterium]